jgi:hypothetical protein
MTERSPRRDESADAAKGRDIPRGTDEHADTEQTPDDRDRSAKPDRATADEKTRDAGGSER